MKNHQCLSIPMLEGSTILEQFKTHSYSISRDLFNSSVNNLFRGRTAPYLCTGSKLIGKTLVCSYLNEANNSQLHVVHSEDKRGYTVLVLEN